MMLFFDQIILSLFSSGGVGVAILPQSPITFWSQNRYFERQQTLQMGFVNFSESIFGVKFYRSIIFKSLRKCSVEVFTSKVYFYIENHFQENIDDCYLHPVYYCCWIENRKCAGYHWDGGSAAGSFPHHKL